MLTSLHIKNFKAWKDTTRIRLAPLTVFFGANSSGKSSLNQFLLMLKQTAQSPDRQRVLHLGDKNAPVDLGTYQDITHRHVSGERIEFFLKWEMPSPLEFEDVLAQGKKYSGERMAFHAVVGPAGGSRQDIVVWEMGYRLGDPKSSGLEIVMKRKTNGNGKKDEYDLKPESYNLERRAGRPWSLPSPTRFYGFPEEAVANYQNAGLLSDLTLALERELQKIHYLGPLRQHPQRSYTWSGENPEHVGWRGERAVDAILSARRRKISFGKNKWRKPFEEIIAYWLKELGLIESFDVKQIAVGKRDYEVLVRPLGTNEPANITDVGFGVSQVLPVLVECFYCQPGSTLILEQPEIHLHPSVQSALADLLIAAVTSRESGKDRNIQLLVESHSEHFLRRLQRRIAEEVISPDMTAIYFCESAYLGSRLHSLDLDMFGNITNWPQDFFGDEVGDLAAMTEAAFKRSQKASRA